MDTFLEDILLFHCVCIGADVVMKAHDDGSAKSLGNSEITQVGDAEPKAEALDDGCTPGLKGMHFSFWLGSWGVG